MKGIGLPVACIEALAIFCEDSSFDEQCSCCFLGLERFFYNPVHVAQRILVFLAGH
jgi:hypothetical protein